MPPLLGGPGDLAGGEQGVQLGVALVHADLHPAAQPGVPALEAVAQRLCAQPGAAVAEVLEAERLQRDSVRVALPGEGLHDPVRPDLVEAAVEAELHPVPGGDVAPAAAGAGVPAVEGGRHPVRADPPSEQLRVGVRPEQLRRGGREVPGDADDRDRRIGLDRRGRHRVVHAVSSRVGRCPASSSSSISASTASSRRYRASARCR